MPIINFIKYSLLAFFSLTIYLITASEVSAEVLTVGQFTEKFKTISEAIETAKEADTILISEGVYEENIVLTKKNLEIIGENRDKVILKSSADNKGYGIELKNSDLKILNLTIQNFNYGIYSDTGNYQRILINNLKIINNGDIELPTGCGNNNPYKNCQNWHDSGGALRLRNVSESKITNNLITENQQGILLDSVLQDNGNNEISANHIFENQGFAVKLLNSSSNNLILGNEIYKNKGAGIIVERSDNKYEQNLKIFQNNIYQNSNDGIELSNQRNFLIQSNQILKNSGTDSIPYSPGQDPIYGGIYLANSLKGVLSQNEISDNSLVGIHLEKNSADISIYNNEIVLHGKSPQALDNGSHNEFDKEKVGNYWSDFKGLVNNSEYNYAISGTAKNRDNYPLESNPNSTFEKKLLLYISKYYPGQITLGWKPLLIDNFREYEIEIKEITTGKSGVFNSNNEPALSIQSNTTLDILSLKESTDYSARIVIKDAFRKELFSSNEIIFKTLNQVEIPTAPKALNLTSLESGQIFLSWFKNPTAEEVSYYEIYRRENNLDYQYVKKVVEPNTFFYDEKLDPNKFYSYKIKSKNTNGYSPFSDEIGIFPNSQLMLDSSKNINLISSSEITLNTVVSRTLDNRSELLFTPKLTQKIALNKMLVSGLQSVVSNQKYPSLNQDYTFLSDNTYYYFLSDTKKNSGIVTLPEEALLSIRYSNDDIKSINEDSLVIAYLDLAKEKWMPLLSQVNPNSKVVMAKIRYLGVFKLMSRKNLMNFTDLKKSDWSYGYIQNLNRSGIINGHEDKTFRPLDFATRAEVIKMVLTANGYKIPEVSLEDPCSDIAKDKWFSPYFQLALGAKLIGGYNDGSCRPENVINRVEALKIIIGEKALNYQTSFDFKDKAEIPNWAHPYVGYALDFKIVKGFSDNTFKPFEPIRRQELAKIIYENFKL